ncbi:lysine-specific demethylase JMJ26-like isoform X2 [Apium graveolens]|uniref:lysine-specific demethylase JMJ26-like isoform X2 n=1 Tax=Apium graveolens TaxID=4045 RepID=UPI003D7B2286
MEGTSHSGSKRKAVQQAVVEVTDSDSSDSSTTTNYTLKRCKIEKSGADGEAKSCHQCKRNDKGRVVNCSKCEKKRYCTRCISNNYPNMNEEDFVEACPFCRDICNCKSCLRLDFPIKNETRLSEDDKIHHSKYLLKRLLPFVRQIHEQQIMEREMEAKIGGLSMSDVKVQIAYCPIDERMNCDYCRTSIADYHRSCTRCSYDLCITCCQELRDCCLHGQKEIMQDVVPEVGYLHGETCAPLSNGNLGTTTEMRDGDLVKAKPEWKPNKDGSISCPPESIGGCGKGILKLNQVLPDNWLSDMLVKAEKVYELYKLNDLPETPVHRSPCYKLAYDNNAKKKLRKAASRENSEDNCLFSPSAKDIEAGDLKHFQAHWLKGEPVIISGVLDTTYGLSWEPMVMSRAMHDKSQTDLAVVNCLNWCELLFVLQEDYSVSSFFKGYSEGILDLSDWPQMLKLNDWPPSGLLEDHLPRHNVEFISALPFKEYTHPHSGYLNLAVKLPNDHLTPDTGPKLYAAYGFSQELGRGDSVKKINCHESDVVYVLTHIKEMTFTPSELAEVKKLKEKHHLQDQRELYLNRKFGLEQQQQEHNDIEELEKAESGALWDIYRREDASKLKEYLSKHFGEFRHTYCLPVKQVFDPIHDGAFFLDSDHKRRLKQEYGIEPWTVVQNLGDAVFIPAGCPFQVRNLKVSTGFVSPENLDACLRLTEEIRVLPQEHGAKEDKLGVKKLILYAMRQVLDNLDAFPKKTECVNINSGSSSKEGGDFGSEPGFDLESESYFHPATQNVYARRQSKKNQRGIFSLRCDANRIGSDFQEAANVSKQISHVLTKTVQPLSSNDSPGSCSQLLRGEPISCEQTEYMDISSDSSKKSEHLGSSFDLESEYNPATQKVYSRSQSKDRRGMFRLRCDLTPVESDFQKEDIISQEVSHTITKSVQLPSKNDCSVKLPGQSSSQVSYSQAPRSVSAEMVGFFNHLEEQIQEDKFDVYRVLPPQIQLDEEIIQEHEKVLKKYLSGRLLDLANDSNFENFNKALHFLLACRRIPSHLQQGFVTLRWDLPNLTSRAYELHKEVNRGMVMPLARSKEREQLKSILGNYRQVEYNLVELEKEKDANLLVIARLVEQMKDHNLDEIIKLQASNEAIDAKINKFAEEAKALHKDATAQNYKVIHLEAMRAEYEANVENAMNRWVTMELKWKERVESLDY